MLANYHTHTTFCDGKNTPEEIVLACIERGFCAIGFSGHGYTPYDLHCCLRDTEGYIAEITRLKKKYEGKIEVFLGIEEDAFAPVDRRPLDYLIGSCHYMRHSGGYHSLDWKPEKFRACLDLYDGDYLQMAEEYYDAFCTYLESRRPDIIGHFDLLTKFDESDGYGMLADPRYREIAERGLARAARVGSVFEVNTGAISRGFRRDPYPSPHLLHLLHRLGGEVILTADAHTTEHLSFGFDEARAALREIGFRHVRLLRSGAFVKDAL